MERKYVYMLYMYANMYNMYMNTYVHELYMCIY